MPKGVYPHKRIDPLIRFWPLVQKTVGCWFWIGHLNNKGYGDFNVYPDNELAHRFSFRKANPEVNIDDLLVLHRCDVRRCVNPSHLFTGTAQDNTDDMMRKGRWRLPGHIKDAKEKKQCLLEK